MRRPRVHREPARKKQVNTVTCPTCKAKPGESCAVLTTRGLRELTKTHFPQPAQYQAPPPTPQELAARKTSQDILDARYVARNTRIENSRRHVNGG